MSIMWRSNFWFLHSCNLLLFCNLCNAHYLVDRGLQLIMCLYLQRSLCSCIRLPFFLYSSAAKCVHITWKWRKLFPKSSSARLCLALLSDPITSRPLTRSKSQTNSEMYLLYDVILLIYYWHVCVFNLWKEEIKNEWMNAWMNGCLT